MTYQSMLQLWRQGHDFGLEVALIPVTLPTDFGSVSVPCRAVRRSVMLQDLPLDAYRRRARYDRLASKTNSTHFGKTSDEANAESFSNLIPVMVY